jgi:hypothetical protein
MVKGYVKSVMDVIESLKKQELDEEEQKAKTRKAMENMEDDDSFTQPIASTRSRRFSSATAAGSTIMTESASLSEAPPMLRRSTPPREGPERKRRQ